MKKTILFSRSLLQRYFSSGFFIALPQVISLLISIITLPIVLRSIPVEGYGILQFVLAVQAWMIVISGGNITLGAKKGIAEGKYGTFIYAFVKRFQLLLGIGIVAFIIIQLLAYFNIIFVREYYWLFVSADMYLVVGYLPQIAFPEFFVATKKFKEYALWKCIMSMGSIGGAAIVAYLSHSVLLYAIAQFVCMAVIGIFGMIYILFKYNIFDNYKNGNIDKTCYSFGLKLIPSQIIQSSSTQLSNFIVGPFFGFSNFAIFSLALKLEIMFRNFFTSIFYTLFYPDFVEWGKHESRRILREKSILIVVFSGFLAIGMWLLGYMYIILFLPSTYHDAIGYLAILLIGFPAFMLQIGIKTILEAFLQHRDLSFITIVPSVIFVPSLYILGKYFSITGIIIAISMNAWITMFFYYVVFFYRDKIRDIIMKKYSG